jgi:hypothetical protein
VSTVLETPAVPPLPPPPPPGVERQRLAPQVFVKLKHEENKVLYGELGGKLSAVFYDETRYGGEPRFRAGDRVIFVNAKSLMKPGAARFEQKAPDGTTALLSAIIKWSEEREKAVKFALAPGWDRERARCPWHSAPGIQDQRSQDAPRFCESCGRQLACASHPTCPSCKMLKGECHFSKCPRKIGPATRGMELGLAAAEESDNQKAVGPLRLTTTRGQYPRFKLDVRQSGHPQAESEGVPKAKDGEDDRDTIFFIVEGPGLQERQTASYDANARDGRSIRGYHYASTDGPKPTEIYQAKGTFAATLWLLARGDGLSPFKKPGTYIVYAAAGRLVSNPLTVIVEDPGKVAPQVRPDPEAQKRIEAEEAEKAKLRAGPQPRWQPGGDTVEAVDAASGKLLWKMNPGFPVGNVAVAGGQWAITSQDGRQVVTVDAATGKMLRRDDLAPPKPAGPREGF